MGRLRHDEDFGFLSDVTEEVIDLFGTSANLYRVFEASAENVTVRDPLYDEPSLPNTVQRKKYRIKIHWQDLNEAAGHYDTGMNFENTKTAFVALAHLVNVGIEKDVAGDYISEGDVVEINIGTHNVTYWDIVNTNKTGFSNNSHQYVGYNLQLKRNTNFDPTRYDGVVT